MSAHLQGSNSLTEVCALKYQGFYAPLALIQDRHALKLWLKMCALL